MAELLSDQLTRPEDCDFCGIIDRPVLPYDITEPIDANGELLLKPALGMLVPGHFLVIPKDHGSSLASSTLDLEMVEETVGHHTDFLSTKFGSMVWVEHGSDGLRPDKPGSGGCVVHTHLHVFPARFLGLADIGDHIQQSLPWQKLNRFEDLSQFQGEPYIYLRRYLGRSASKSMIEGQPRWSEYIVPNPQIPGQFVQRQIAEVYDIEDPDWAVHDSAWAISQTFTALGWGPGWTRRESKWYCDPETRVFEIGEKRNLPGASNAEELRTWSIGAPGSPGSHADLEQSSHVA